MSRNESTEIPSGDEHSSLDPLPPPRRSFVPLSFASATRRETTPRCAPPEFHPPPAANEHRVFYLFLFAPHPPPLYLHPFHAFLSIPRYPHLLSTRRKARARIARDTVSRFYQPRHLRDTLPRVLRETLQPRLIVRLTGTERKAVKVVKVRSSRLIRPFATATRNFSARLVSKVGRLSSTDAVARPALSRGEIFHSKMETAEINVWRSDCREHRFASSSMRTPSMRIDSEETTDESRRIGAVPRKKTRRQCTDNVLSAIGTTAGVRRVPKSAPIERSKNFSSRSERFQRPVLNVNGDTSDADRTGRDFRSATQREI